LAEHKARKEAEKAAGTGSGGNTPMEGASGAQNSPLGQSPGSFVRSSLCISDHRLTVSTEQRVSLHCSPSHIWRFTTRCGLWIIFTRAVFAACGSLPTAICFTTTLFRPTRCPISTSVLSAPAVPSTAKFPAVGIPTTWTEFSRWPTTLWIRFASWFVQWISGPSIQHTPCPWRPTKPTA
jgi:hypothetical protein